MNRSCKARNRSLPTTSQEASFWRNSREKIPSGMDTSLYPFHRLTLSLARSATTSLRGTIKDPTGALVPGAKVTITDNATGKQFHRTTDSCWVPIASPRSLRQNTPSRCRRAGLEIRPKPPSCSSTSPRQLISHLPCKPARSPWMCLRLRRRSTPLTLRSATPRTTPTIQALPIGRPAIFPICSPFSPASLILPEPGYDQDDSRERRGQRRPLRPGQHHPRRQWTTTTR